MTMKEQVSGSKIHMKLSRRVMIEKVLPEIDGGEFPIKRTVGEKVIVRANVFADGHDEVSAVLLYRADDETRWRAVRMNAMGNDHWVGSFVVEKKTPYFYTVQGFLNEFINWRHGLEKKLQASQDVTLDLQMGVAIIEETAQRVTEKEAAPLRKWAQVLKTVDQKSYQKAIDTAFKEKLLDLMENNLDSETSTRYDKELRVQVERKLSGFSSWYEFFPRSWGSEPGKHGTFKDCERILPHIADMGFDIVYLPPIHPIGETHRKGKNNSVRCEPGEPGCPWAIGSKEGGHKSINPDLGTPEDFKSFIKAAQKNNLEVALDLAFQCSPDHPYVKEHPQWFKWRPDGTVQFAENPPKKYEDVLPINFETEDWENLWIELKSIVLFWIEKGVQIFRVDNPHTKPFRFWDWLISEVKKDYPDVIFLAEAFTRPNIMYRLAKGGFTQSYTYFTWRYTKHEFMDYMRELAHTELADYFRPNFWPNTPDILPEHLQYGGRAAFIIRAVLAATLSSNYGIYGPAFELCEAEALENKEEYLNSEKYEIKSWDWDREGHLKDILTVINQVRKKNPSLHTTRNLRFLDINNDSILCYYKSTSDYSNIIMVLVSLDPYHTQAGWVRMPLEELGIDRDRPYLAHDLLSGDKYIWQGESCYVELDPGRSPAHIIRVRRHVKREQDFDYYL